MSDGECMTWVWHVWYTDWRMHLWNLYFILISANWSWAGANCANPDLAFISISYPTLDNWEKEINNTPCISVTHSKSLCDTLTKFWNTTQQHIWKIRTKCDFQKRGGQVRWIEGARVLADCPTKRMGSSYSRSVMKNGLRFLSEKCFQRMHEPSIMLLISAN